MTAYKILMSLLLLACLAVAAPAQPWAQSYFQDDFQDDPFFESDGDFFQEGDEFGEPGGEDFTEGGQFIDEEVGPAGTGSVTIQGRRTQLLIDRERRLLPLNIGWGAGTGLLIGGWFALIEAGNDRETQRSLGLGVVIGALLGMTVGLKTVISPDAPRAPGGVGFIPPSVGSPPDGLAMRPKPSPPMQVGFALRF